MYCYNGVEGINVPEDLFQEVKPLVLGNDLQMLKWMGVKSVNRMKMKLRRLVLLTCISKAFRISICGVPVRRSYTIELN